MRSTHHHCEECWAVLDSAKVLRCTKCKVCFYCSAACQKRNWKLHKRVCSTDPELRPLIPVEMAVERALKTQPTVQAPKEAFCYICLEGDDGGKLMRGCACRGDSAGFVHLECLTELAMSKEASRDLDAFFDSWQYCGNCKQLFTGALGLEMTRRFWRRHRSSHDVEQRYNSTKFLATRLGCNGEVDAASQLLNDASTFVGNDKGMLLDLKLFRAGMLRTNGQNLEGLELLQAMLPEAKEYTRNPQLYGRAMQQVADVLLALDRYQEAHEAAADLVAFAKANCGLEDPGTLSAVRTYAVACAKLGRVEEANLNFKDVLATQTRVLGREHPYTICTIQRMRSFGFAVPTNNEAP